MHNSIKILAYLIMIVGIITSVTVGGQTNSWIMGVLVFAASLVSAIILLGFAEIIESLKRIESKICENPEEFEVLNRFRGEMAKKQQ